ncbi:aldehyde dehydrogenase family protein [Candidatus Viridilinea mediisalina]|uniref:Aldehyde dehydrogenase n=1 Tax=Candidatus Viridilinea mediisalina TaxID=2024553 RepID=A0A2A6RDL6_9CHLR|nr:aldehyde dehydrogenase family protein [Candidatus Viridilinea mediisalina]PDV99308.1 aldehyde dehydrogenase [Candidatus Viridilinea mediisalina]
MTLDATDVDLEAHGLFINGAWCAADAARTFTVYEPATGQPLARCAHGSRADVDRAVAAARAAFDDGPWPHTPHYERAQILHEIAQLIEANAPELAELESRDGGVPLRATTFNDIPLGMHMMHVFAELARRSPYEPMPWNDFPTLSWNFVWRNPYGVCAQIIPWNYAFCMTIWKLGPALATGNTIVFKPSSLAPLSAIRLIKLIDESGLLPKGVLNMVTGSGPEVGEYLVGHPRVDKIAFTGSTEVGRKIMAIAAPHIKKVTLELGGKSPSILLPDADLDKAIDGVLFGMFYHAGQLCEAGTRCLVPSAIYDEVVERLVQRTRQLRVGDPLDLATDVGPLISHKQRETVEGYIALGRAEGARLLIGGGRPLGASYAQGSFVEPTIFGEVNNRSRLAQEEIFGPVLALIRYDDVGEAIAMANDTMYGLAASVWSQDIQQAIDVARRIRAGTVGINEHHVLNPYAPFGGFKESGIGREMGVAGMLEYTEPTHIHVDFQQQRDGKLWWDALLPPNEEE